MEDAIWKRLDELLEEVRAIQAELKYDVLKKEGSVAQEVRTLLRTVEEIKGGITTKEEIQAALNKQTAELKRSQRFQFSFRQKVLAGLATAIVLFLNLYAVVIK